MVSNAGLRETGTPQRQFDLERNLGLGPSRPSRRQGFERRRRQHHGRLPHDLDFALVLNHPGGFDDAFGGHEASRDERLQPRESVQGHDGALDSDGGSLRPRPLGGDALFNRARRELDAEMPQPLRCRRPLLRGS